MNNYFSSAEFFEDIRYCNCLLVETRGYQSQKELCYYTNTWNVRKVTGYVTIKTSLLLPLSVQHMTFHVTKIVITVINVDGTGTQGILFMLTLYH